MDGQLIPKSFIGYIVRDMMIIELSPTFSCLLLAGKVGSNMAAEVMPKVMAAVMMIPLLVVVSAFVGIAGGYLASVPVGLFSHNDYVTGLRLFFDAHNLFIMLVKALTFAFILTSVSCYQGYFVKGGSIELGEASTRAMVYSVILILVADYIIALILT